MTAVLPLPAPAAARATAHRGHWAGRASVALAVVAVVVLGGGTTAANATFSDAATLPSMKVGTGTVAPATNVRVDVSCTTTTTIITRTYTPNSWGGYSQTGHTQTSSTADATSNVESDETVRTDGSNGQYRTTQTIKDTQLYAALRWRSSTSARVSGYRMTAHTVYGPIDMGGTGPTATQMTADYDADVVDYGARLSIDTVTDYGWIATSALSNVVKC